MEECGRESKQFSAGCKRKPKEYISCFFCSCDQNSHFVGRNFGKKGVLWLSGKPALAAPYILADQETETRLNGGLALTLKVHRR